ncbi:MAG: DNA polymerase III subunit gamma/tau [Planctomycetaceae bacterium]|nr:DNA polymerase III subunit gamma/tau [Planctomycetaceae bacterium]
MEYTVLARRFRPQSFGEVVGQEMISQALKNAIASERVAHAYLFTGARGVGKTSTARILAKSLNCPQAHDGDPCNACEICRSISVGSDMDVLEIDGASNRGIDEIRDLRANVSVKPMRCRYKIYIIDEVHMLTTPAFNALLKTLEEPPANVKFIFCTTEPEKVPDTILSRCQRFDFGIIATASIQQRLAEIATAEGVEVEPAALQLVARRANGSMRDSQSLFDQLLAFGGRTIGASDVHRLLGTAPDDRLIDLSAALIARDRGRALQLLHAALDSGTQLGELADQLLAYFRDLMVLAAGAARTRLISVGDEQRPTLAAQAEAWGLSSILAALQILSEAKARMKGVAYGSILAELALVRIASLEDFQGLGAVLEHLASGKLPPEGAVMPARAVTRALPITKVTQPSTTPSTTPDTGHRGLPPSTPSEQPAISEKSSDPFIKKDFNDKSVQSPDQPTESVPVVARIPFESGRENEIWAQVVSNLSDMTKSHAKNILNAAISGPNQLVLTFPKSYDQSKRHFERSADQLRLLEAAVERVTGTPVRILLTVNQAETPGSESEARSSRPEADRRQQIADGDSLVQRALAAFGATLIRVETESKATPD